MKATTMTIITITIITIFSFIKILLIQQEKKNEFESKTLIFESKTNNTNPNPNKIWFIGWIYIEVADFIFPEFEKITVPQRLWSTSTKEDILIVGMHGPESKKFKFFHLDFKGKILVVNGEPHGIIPPPGSNNPRMYQLSGPIPADIAYNSMNTSSHYFRGYSGLRKFLTQRDNISKLFDKKFRQKYNGTQSKIIYANSNCVAHRQNAVSKLAQILQVDTIGKCTVPGTNRVEGGPREKLLQNWIMFGEYKYCVCMENTGITGYISEKLTNAFIAGCLPIYYGTKEVFHIFHPNSFLFYDPMNPLPSIEKIQYLEKNLTAYEEIFTYPILRNGTDTLNKYFSYSDEFGDGSIKRQIREMMRINSSASS